MKGRRLLGTGLKLAISGGLLFLLYRKIPVQDIGRLLLTIDFRYLVPIVLLLLLNTLLSTWKWQLFLAADGVKLPFFTLMTTYMIAYFYNMFLPSNIGGDSYRIYDVARRSGEGVRTAAAVFADRVSGFVAMVSMGVAASAWVAARFGQPLFFLGPLAVLAALFLLLWALHRQTPVRLFMRLTRLDRVGLLVRLVEKFFLSFSCYGRNARLLAATLVISFVFQGSVITIIYFLARCLHARVDYLYFCAFVPLVGLLEVLPLSINGIGLRDAGYVFFFGWAGMSDLQTRSLALLFLAMSVAYSLLGGLFYLGRTLAGGPDPDRDGPRARGE